MASYNPRDPRFRRSLNGRPLPRHKLPPGMLRPPVKRPSKIPSIIARVLALVAVLVMVLAVAGVGTAYSAYSQLTESLAPRLDVIKDTKSFQTTRIYDRYGTLLYEFFGAGKRTRVQIGEISPLLINATVAIEDKTFFQNQGVDYEGILKAVGRSVQAGEVTGGASTITQQLIKRIVLNDNERADNNKYQRKLSEIVLAQELSQRYSKNAILELYLNEIYYGNLSYGIEAAANVYFGVRAKDLTLAQASLLAGLPQLPTVYDPINYLEGDTLKGVTLGANWRDLNSPVPPNTPPPKSRQVAVLRQMVDQGYVTADQARAALAEDLRFAKQQVPLNAPHFVYYIRKLLEDQYGQQFANEGLSVYTTLDLNMQQMVQQTAKERIQELRERNIHNAAVVVMQPNTGQILAMVGSIDYNLSIPSTTPGEKGNVLDGQVNVTVRERQPGSALKPFTYLAAMERGMTPATVLWDVPTQFLGGPQPYAPLNYNAKWNGPVRIRTALANSLNMPAVKALKFAGIGNTINLLQRVGIGGLTRGESVYGLSLTLGGGEVTPLELTTAYNTLASGGRYYPPVGILRVVDGKGNTVQAFKPGQSRQVLAPDHVAIITDMMSDDNARKPIWGLNSKLKLSRPAAVKTGTSNDWKDAWAAGFTPYVTVGVWTGNNNNEATAKVESISGGGVIWHNVMETLFADPQYEKVLTEPYNGALPLTFPMPASVVRKPICALPGPFGGYKEELFAPDMLTRTATLSTTGLLTPTATTGAGRGAKPQQLGCDIYDSVTVVRLSRQVVAPIDPANPDAPVDDPATQTATRYCRPNAGDSVPPGRLTQLSSWKVPPPDPSEKVEYRWSGGSAGGRFGFIPFCTAEDIASITAPPPDQAEITQPDGTRKVRMPDLRFFGENQAKERLAALGLTNIYVDYQSRDRIPEAYDQFSSYAVVSTLPRAGEYVSPDETIVLGIRAPDPDKKPDTPKATAEPKPDSSPLETPVPPPEQPPDSAPVTP